MFNKLKNKNIIRRVRILGNFAILFRENKNEILFQAEFTGRAGDETVHINSRKVWRYDKHKLLSDLQEVTLDGIEMAEAIKIITSELIQEGFHVQIHDKIPN